MQLVDRRTYRGKEPKPTANGFVDDRTITYVSSWSNAIGYTSPAFAGTRRILAQTFLKWASHDVTEQLPAGCYMTWEQYLKQERKKTGLL